MEYGVHDLTNAHYERTRRLIWHLLNKTKLPPHIDKDDLAQDVWVKLISAEFYPEMEGASSYLAEAVRSVVAEATGEEAKHSHVGLPQVAVKNGDLTVADLDDILLQLRAKDRALLEDRYLSGLSVSAMARKRQEPPEKTRMGLRRAIRAARRLGGKC